MDHIHHILHHPAAKAIAIGLITLAIASATSTQRKPLVQVPLSGRLPVHIPESHK